MPLGNAKRLVPKQSMEPIMERKSVRKVVSDTDVSGMRFGMQRTASGRSLKSWLHSREKWEEQGGWQPKAPGLKQLNHMERDESMVNLLNIVDPGCLVDKPPKLGEVANYEQHSALSRRGV